MTSSKQVILKIAGEEVDITEMPVLTIGDKKALKAAGVSFANLRDMPPEDEANLILFIVRKVRPATTLAEIDALPIKTGQDILNYMVTRSSEVDSPLSPSSTPSPGTTGGAAAS